MKYWVKTIYPLQPAKGFLNTTQELMEWINDILYDAYERQLKLKPKNILKSFVVLKVEEDKLDPCTTIFRSTINLPGKNLKDYPYVPLC